VLTLRERLEEAGFETRSYSGRGMFGKECLAVTADSDRDVFAAIEPAEIKAARIDSMGRRVVAYWPAVAFALLLALLGTARAESTACDHAALARAEAGLLPAQARYTAARDWGSQNRAVALVAAAGEQLRTAQALCTVTEVAPKLSPFEADADPFESESPAPAWHEPVPVPGIPYLVDAEVEMSCPGPDCPVVSLAVPVELEGGKTGRW
jgi:hypothetical protein